MAISWGRVIFSKANKQPASMTTSLAFRQSSVPQHHQPLKRSHTASFPDNKENRPNICNTTSHKRVALAPKSTVPTKSATLPKVAEPLPKQQGQLPPKKFKAFHHNKYLPSVVAALEEQNRTLREQNEALTLKTSQLEECRVSLLSGQKIFRARIKELEEQNRITESELWTFATLYEALMAQQSAEGSPGY